MNIYARPGSKVIFTNKSGYDHERTETPKILTVGKVYTVKSTDVGSWSSTVVLEEFPQRHFNTVLFEDVKES